MPSPLAGVARFPRARLGHAPTPIDPAPNLGAALGIDLYIKRDDCTGLAFGGNKVRQLEFHFGEARARGADTVLVIGAVQSNLVRIGERQRHHHDRRPPRRAGHHPRDRRVERRHDGGGDRQCTWLQFLTCYYDSARRPRPDRLRPRRRDHPHG